MTQENPKITVVGAYRLVVDDALIQEAMDLKYPATRFSEERRRLAKPGVVEEMSSAVLIELIIEGADENYSADDFGQPNVDQAAYMEAYLSSEGEEVLSEGEPPVGDFLRVVFFLHFFDHSLPLNTSYGQVSVPNITEMPERLSRLIQYEPVD
ncbi:MAG: hypothetical protein ACKVP0_23755 [Pirellulaceae bacterium]